VFAYWVGCCDILWIDIGLEWYKIGVYHDNDINEERTEPGLLYVYIYLYFVSFDYCLVLYLSGLCTVIGPCCLEASLG
jgi:hypothetical protein